MSGAPVLLDMTQFVSHPRATGIQRVLLAMVEGLRPPGTSILPAARLAGGYVVVTRDTAAELLRGQFERRHPGAGTGGVRDQWLSRQVRTIPAGRLPDLVDGFLLAELTSSDDTLEDVAALRRAGVMTAAVYYDSLPVVHPGDFPGWDQVSADRYYRTVAALDDVAFISDAVRAEFEARVARRTLPNTVVAFPGVDGTAAWQQREAPVPPRLVCVGAVEPRKRTDVVVEAVRRLRARGDEVELVVVGGVSTSDRGFVAGLREHVAGGVLTWLEDASDDEVEELVAGSSAMVYAGEREGYGLPPLEALRAGVPCITSRRLPSLEAVGPEGLLLVDRFEPDDVVAAVEVLLAPGGQDRLRAQARTARTPTWAAFNDQLSLLLTRAAARVGSGGGPGGGA